jgi:hypothetical protein
MRRRKLNIPKEIQRQINSLAHRRTKHLYPYHLNHLNLFRLERAKLYIQIAKLMESGVPLEQAVDSLINPWIKKMDELTRKMKEIQAL